jgi:hypothetical protein
MQRRLVVALHAVRTELPEGQEVLQAVHDEDAVALAKVPSVHFVQESRAVTLANRPVLQGVHAMLPLEPA